MGKEAKIKILKDGPYEVCGNISLAKEIIVDDKKEGFPEKWKIIKKFSPMKAYHLCRCGNSKNKPFCDGAHLKGFNGKETAGFGKYNRTAEIVNGPELILKDNEKLCSVARFCHLRSGTWNLTTDSSNPANRKEAIRQACCCPSGRLVAVEKETGKDIEKNFKRSISLIEYEDEKSSGPLWAKGKIPIESSSGKIYEKRNRCTLCRCGKSKNKPFCDGTHLEINFSDVGNALIPE